ncbi:MAG: aldo/keto reductase [Pseudomonadota bacterium]
MRQTQLGPYDNVSRLTLGAAGLGNVWGETTEEEAVETLQLALDAGINLIDTAPSYGNCEALLGRYFNGSLPKGVRITTKCQLGNPDRGTAGGILTASVEASLKAMKLDCFDVFFLHSFISADGADFPFDAARVKQFVTPWSQYTEEVIPAFEDLKRRGLIKAWAITGTGVPTTILKALNHGSRPAIIQAITNLMDSPGSLKAYAEPANPRTTIAEAVSKSVGVMGIRAVQAGALTEAIDRPMKDTHPEMKDFVRAAAFRDLCKTHGLSVAATAHRYALSMAGVDTVVLGVKNRSELIECIEAETAGPLPTELMNKIDALGLS